ncbi:hypothetical protein EDB86DRAFT_3180883 [Lactarius hatsudake]|nr:hypothetical protein EDB86DRAFT_3180883 [Lactarius hatsudake]
MELRNMHKQAKQPKGKGKAWEKPCHDDDIPLQPSEEVNNQYKCLLDLKRHLLCQKHSTKGQKTYCWVEPGAGHCEMEHREMTYWAKLISIREVDVTLQLPNAKLFDRPSTKKPKGMHAAPEIHIAINIMPTPGSSGSATMQGSYMVSDSPIVQPSSVSAPGLLALTGVSNTCTKPSSNGPCGMYNNSRSPIITMLDCMGNLTILTISELLSMIDYQDQLRNQTHDLKYVDMTNVYTLRVEELAKIGHLDMDGACRLWKYMEKVALAPLGLLDTIKQEVQDNNEEDEPESHDVMGWPSGGCKEEYIEEMDEVESAHKLDGSEGGSDVSQEI